MQLSASNKTLDFFLSTHIVKIQSPFDWSTCRSTILGRRLRIVRRCLAFVKPRNHKQNIQTTRAFDFYVSCESVPLIKWGRVTKRDLNERNKVGNDVKCLHNENSFASRVKQRPCRRSWAFVCQDLSPSLNALRYDLCLYLRELSCNAFRFCLGRACRLFVTLPYRDIVCGVDIVVYMGFRPCEPWQQLLCRIEPCNRVKLHGSQQLVSITFDLAWQE